jgi:hypothetical protein
MGFTSSICIVGKGFISCTSVWLVKVVMKYNGRVDMTL